MENALETITNEVNIIEVVKETINTLCNSLFDSVNNTVFPLLDDIVFINGDIVNSKSMQNLFGNSISEGILILANSLIFAFILYYSIRLILSHFTENSVDPPYKFFIKAVIIVILMNSSLSLCSFLIDSTYDITSFFCELRRRFIWKRNFFYNFY